QPPPSACLPLPPGRTCETPLEAPVWHARLHSGSLLPLSPPGLAGPPPERPAACGPAEPRLAPLTIAAPWPAGPYRPRRLPPAQGPAGPALAPGRQARLRGWLTWIAPTAPWPGSLPH